MAPTSSPRSSWPLLPGEGCPPFVTNSEQPVSFHYHPRSVHLTRYSFYRPRTPRIVRNANNSTDTLPRQRVKPRLSRRRLDRMSHHVATRRLSSDTRTPFVVSRFVRSSTRTRREDRERGRRRDGDRERKRDEGGEIRATGHGTEEEPRGSEET